MFCSGEEDNKIGPLHGFFYNLTFCFIYSVRIVYPVLVIDEYLSSSFFFNKKIKGVALPLILVMMADVVMRRP